MTEIEKKWKKMKKSEKKTGLYLGIEVPKKLFFFKIRIALSFIKCMFMFAADELISDVSITHEETGTIFRTRLLYP